MYTKTVEQAIQVIGGVMPGESTVRLGANVPMEWDYEFRMEDAKQELGLSSEEKMTLLLAREYVYSLLEYEDLPEPVKIWREAQETIKKEMDEFNSFMAYIASDAKLNQPTLVSQAKKYFPSLDINNKMKIKDIVNFILYGIEPPKIEVKPEVVMEEDMGKIMEDAKVLTNTIFANDPSLMEETTMPVPKDLKPKTKTKKKSKK